jgi:hypothetical protein
VRAWARRVRANPGEGLAAARLSLTGWLRRLLGLDVKVPAEDQLTPAT